MNYFVIGPDGSKYGPADISLLNTWVAEGRVTPVTMLESDTGVRVSAGTLQGLNFPAIPPQPFEYGGPQAGPTWFSGGQSNYYRPQGSMAGNSNIEVMLAWVFAGLSVFSVCLCGIFSFAFTIAGIVLAVLAKNKNQPNAKAAMIVNIVLLVLWIIGGIGYAVFLSSVMFNPNFK